MSDDRVRAFVRFGWIALSITVAVIVWGAVVRATGSGAGCGSHWPLCNGDVVPLAPAASTVIEYAHRVTSGMAMMLSVALVVSAWRIFPAGHRARTWAAATLGFMLIEAAVGAGLVLLGLVENNASTLRAGYIAVHLINTMLLMGAMTGTIWWAGAPSPKFRARSRRLGVTLVLMMMLAATGAIVALGDTLFPHASLAQGMAADFDPTAHFLIRLRVFHPFFGLGVALITIAQARRYPVFRAPPGDSLRPIVITLVLLQVALGLLNVIMLAPLPLQMAHLLGSSVLWIVMVWSWLTSAVPLPPLAAPTR